MSTTRRVLGCIDASGHAQAVTDAAAWAALRLQVPLELLHVIDRHPPLAGGQDHSGIIGADAQEQLLEQLASQEAQRSKAAREEGRRLLQSLRERASVAGATADVRLRHGDVEETLREQQAGAACVVLGRRGASAGPGTPAGLGGHARWLVEALAGPLLLVPAAWTAPTGVRLLCDPAAASRRSLEALVASPLLAALEIGLLPDDPGTTAGLQRMGIVAGAFQQAGFRVRQMPDGGASQTAGPDTLLVVPALAREPLRRWFGRSRTTERLSAAAGPVLLLR